MSRRAQLPSKIPQRRGGPAQRRNRTTGLPRLDQCLQRRPQARITLGRWLASATGTAHPSQHRRAASKFGTSPRDRRLRHLRQPGHRGDPAMSERTCLGRQEQPALPLVQVRQQGGDLCI
jgi:hypothetical protein